MYSVLVADTVAQEGLALLKQCSILSVDCQPDISHEQLLSIIHKYHGLIVRSRTRVTKEIIENAQTLRLIGRAGIGVDNIDVNAASEKKIIVMNTPLSNINATAEQAIALCFTLARQIQLANQSMKEKKWEKNRFMGTELAGKKMGIMGFGNVGKLVAKKAQALGMQVIVYKPNMDSAIEKLYGITSIPLETFFKESDFITIHVRKNQQTTGMINDNAFSLMKTGMFLINNSRGGVVNETALLKALESGKVAGAALDVFEKEPPDFENPLYSHPKCICTPHLGASTQEAQTNVSTDLAKQFVAYFTEGTVQNTVNPNFSVN